MCRLYILLCFLFCMLPMQGQSSADSLQLVRDSLVKDCIFRSLELKEVEVVKMKSLVKTDIDKITCDIENDPDSKTNTMMEMLRNVPMVTVDGQDKITVNLTGKPQRILVFI